MTGNRNEQQAVELMIRYLEGQASAEEARQLSALMRDAPAIRRQCAIMLRQHLQLFEIGEEEAARLVEEKVIPLETAGPGLLARFKWMFGGVAAAAAAVVIFLSINGPAHQGPSVQITAAENVVLASGRTLKAGETVNLDRLAMTSGKLKFRVASGVNLVAQGAVEFEFVHGMLMELKHGQLTADVEPQARGFTILTPNGKVVDLGTKFGVNVELGTSSDVVVFQGLVEVHKSDAGTNQPPLVQLKAGEAVRLAGEGETSPIDSIVTGPASYDWSSRPGGTDSVIGLVRDNNTSRWSNKFYPIIRQGMAEGIYAWPYDVNKPCWWSPDAVSLPGWLAGADVVQTLNEELGNRDLQITVLLNKPARLYVFYEDVGNLPAWLTDNFSATDQHVVLSPDSPALPGNPGERGSYHVRFRVWQREVREPGVVQLGALDKANNQSPPYYMYGVAAKALDEQQAAR